MTDSGRGRALVYAWIGVLVAAATVGWMFQTQFMWRYLTLTDSDVLIFRQAAEAVRDGQPLYDLRFGEVGGWTWPPFGALAVLPTLLVPLDLLQPVSYAISTACLVVVVSLCARPLLDRAPDRPGRALALIGLTLLAIPLTPVADTLGLGQIGLVLLLLVTLDFVVVARRAPRWHGVLLGIATAIKVTPGLFVVHLLVTRQWRAAATAIATTLACWLLAAAVLWRDSADYWGRGLLLSVNDRVDGFGSWVYNQSWMGLVDGLTPPWPTVLWLLLSAATVVVALRASARSHRSGDAVMVLGLVGLASVLVTPIAWHHHAVWVVPALLAVVGDGRTSWRTVGAGVVAVLLMVPSRLPTLPPDRYVVEYVALLVLMLVVVERRETAGPQAISGSPSPPSDRAAPGQSR